MAAVFELLHEQAIVTPVTQLTVAHGLNRNQLAIQLSVSGVLRPDLIVSSTPNAGDPLNSTDLVFSEAVAGRLMIFGSSMDWVQMPSAVQASQLVSSSVYGTERHYLDKFDTYSHTSNYVQKYLEMPVNVVGGTYRLDWHYNWRLSTSSYNWYGEVRVDATPISLHYLEPADSGSDQLISEASWWEGEIAAGSHTCSVWFCTQVSGYTASMYKARLSLIRVA